MYSFAVLYILDGKINIAHQHDLSSMCIVVGLCQNFIFGLYYYRNASTEVIQAIEWTQDFCLKIICCFFMHLLVSPDLLSSISLMKYLQNPASYQHLRSSRMMCCFLMIIKFATGLACETLLIIIFSKTTDLRSESTTFLSASSRILLIFCIFTAVYELPTLLFRLKIVKSKQLDELKEINK